MHSDHRSSHAQKDEYQQRLRARARAAARHARRERAIRWFKRVVLYSVIGYVVFDPTVSFALAPLAVFLVPLTAVHELVIRAWRRATLAAEYYQAALARLDHRWIGAGPSGVRYRDPAHLYADDLDLFGRGSLFQLLCTAPTRVGQDALAAWLMAPAQTQTVRERQAAIAELRCDIDLRETLAVVADDVRRLDADGLRAWADAPAILPSRGGRVFGFCAAVGLLACFTAFVLLGGNWWIPTLAALVVEAGLFVGSRPRLRQIGPWVGPAGESLAALARISRLIRNLSARAPMPVQLLAELQAAICADHRPPSARAAKLYGLLLPSPPVLLLAAQLVPALEAWRARLARTAPDWLAAAGQFEALLAIAGYAYEHPADPFPELVEAGPLFEGEGLAHPLMPADTCVRNDVRLGGQLRLVLISGSNMSGKSTLLRTVGTNTVLALAGAPVPARRLRLSPVTLATAMRFVDSIHDGTSFFMAALVRLRALMQAAHERPPVLFLLDEILPGTNSHDRVVGAEAVLRELLARGALGLVTTHDLALARVVDDLAPQAANFHCEDQLVDGQMTFDYKLRPGVVQKSNALALMRQMGLEV
jgi:MutS domain V